MASYFVVMLDSTSSKENQEKIKKTFEPLKDWLKFSAQNWIVYTNLKASDVRDRLVSNLEPNVPAILVIPVDLEEWSTFARELSRNWLGKERSPETEGE